MNKLIIGLLMLGTAVLSANGASEAPIVVAQTRVFLIFHV